MSLENNSFIHKKIDLKEASIFFPKKYEKLYLLVYFILLPYTVGLLFLFIYIGSGDINFFMEIGEEAFFLWTWAIGYEVLASIAIIYIIKLTISSIKKEKRKG